MTAGTDPLDGLSPNARARYRRHLRALIDARRELAVISAILDLEAGISNGSTDDYVSYLKGSADGFQRQAAKSAELAGHLRQMAEILVELG